MFLYIAEGPGVARRRKIEQQYEKNKGFKKIEFFKRMSTPSHPCVSTKKISPFGPAVWPARGNIHTNVLFFI